MKPIDDAEVWSIVCAYVVKTERGKGIHHRMLAGAIDYARSQGVRLLEAYPIDKDQPSHPDFMFFGSRSLYKRAGFREVERRSPTRVVMRRALRPDRSRVDADRSRDQAARQALEPTCGELAASWSRTSREP
jgi:hypothetical protein